LYKVSVYNQDDIVINRLDAPVV